MQEAANSYSELVGHIIDESLSRKKEEMLATMRMYQSAQFNARRASALAKSAGGATEIRTIGNKGKMRRCEVRARSWRNECIDREGSSEWMDGSGNVGIRGA